MQEESTKLKRLVADLSLDKVMLLDVVMDRYGVSSRTACGCVRLRRSVCYYCSVRDPQLALRQRVRELAHARVRFGYRNAHWFESLADAEEKIDAWRWGYNEIRPHRALQGRTPKEFALKVELGAAESPQ